MANRARGIAMRWACRSAKRKVKKGNSVISKPGGSGGIMRVGAQKSKLAMAPRTSCPPPCRLPRTTAIATAAAPAAIALQRVGVARLGATTAVRLP